VNRLSFTAITKKIKSIRDVDDEVFIYCSLPRPSTFYPLFSNSSSLEDRSSLCDYLVVLEF